MSNRLHNWWHQWLMIADEAATCAWLALRNRSEQAAADKPLRLSGLEPRILFSATPIDPAMMHGGDEAAMIAEVETESTSESDTATIETLSEEAPSQSLTEIIFIDSAVPDIQQLLDDLSASGRDAEVFVLDADRDGLDQITEILDLRSDIDSIHIVSHAEDSAVKLGSVWLSESNLDGYAGQIASWQSALSGNADILLYGCDLASDTSGQTLIDAVSALSGADVAASNDDTGHASFGGDWELEYTTGAIDSQIVFGSQLQENWRGKLQTITVDTAADIVNGSDGLTSLREAILLTNAGGGGDTIILGPSTYNLTLDSLDIAQDVTITGANARSTIIDATGLGKRVFHLDGGSVVTMSGMTIQGGDEENGGGIFVEDGTLYLSDAVLTNNTSNMGGAIHVHGTAHLDSVLLYNNSVTNSGPGNGEGGAIHFHGAAGGSLTNVTISGNTAEDSGGGLWTDSAITITNSTITLNDANDGGGIVNSGGTVDISNSIVAGNISTGPNRDILGAFASDGFNLIGVVGSASGFSGDITGNNGNLGALADNGGPTDTHALLAGSLAIDNGTSAGAPTVDQRSIARDGTPDIGAYELSASITPTSEFLVNMTTTDIQQTVAEDRGSQQAVSVADDGSYVVVWSSLNQDGSGQGVYARRFDATGTAASAEILVNQTTTNDQQWARVASAADGTFVVTWTSNQGATQDIYFRRFAADGTALTGELLANNSTGGIQKDSAIAMDKTTGEFVIAWEGEGPGDTAGIFLRRFNTDGTAKEATDQLANLTDNGIEQDVAIAMNASGDVVVVWEVGGSIKFQIIDSVGVAGAAGTVYGDTVSSAPAVAMDAAGNFVVAYRWDGAIGKGVWAHQFDSSGVETVPWWRVGWGGVGTNKDHQAPSIAMSDDGDFVVTYESITDGGPGKTVFAERFAADTTSLGVVQVNQTTVGDQHMASVAVLDIDNYVVAFTSTDSDQAGVLARQYGTGATNVAPTVTSGGVLSYTEGDGQVFLDSGITVSDPDGTLEGATIRIVSNHTSTEDVLHFTNQNGITGSYDATTGTLSLSGTASVANYETALLSVKYENYSVNPNENMRIVSIQVDDGLSTSGTSRMIDITSVGPLAVDTTSDENDGADTSSIAALTTNKGTDGKVSLREAIEAANNTAGLDTIEFNIADPLVGGAHTILVGAGGLPTITQAVIIDGTTDLDYGTTPIIELVGTSAGAGTAGLTISGDDSTIRGLVINRFAGNGIQITGDNNRIENSFIGLDVSGAFDRGNTQLGIQINGATNNIIGGAGVGNVISGNGFSGIAIVGGTSNNNVIQGNLIGTDATGMFAIGNDDYGIDIWSGGPNNNTIGGTTVDDRNVISGNGWAGVHLSSGTGNIISGNYIGTDINGTAGIANGDTGTGSNNGGIDIDGGATNNVIGTGRVALAHLIAFNTGVGVRVDGPGTIGNKIQENEIHDNVGIGIDLVAGNSARQAASISSVNTDGGTSITITGSYGDATLGADTITIEYFSDPGAAQEGKTYLGSDTLVTDGVGNATINHVIAANVAAGEWITATVTDSAGNTSEFSVTRQAAAFAVPINVTGRETVDDDSDGQIDYIKITTDANLNDDFSGLSMSVAGYTLDVTTPYVTNIDAGGDNDNVFYVMLQESGSADTGATPLVTIVANTTLGQFGGGANVDVDSSGVAATDNAGAVLISATSTQVIGTTIFQADGHQLDLVFSETLSGLPNEVDLEAALTFATGTTDGDNLPSIGTGVDPYSLVTNTQTNDTIRVILNSNNTLNSEGLIVGIHSVQVSNGTSLTDMAGNAANATGTSIIIGDKNDPPTLSATASNPTFTEDGAAVTLFSGSSADTVESFQTFAALILTVTNVSDGADEILGADGFDIELTDGNAGATTTNTLSYNVSVTGSTATVTLSGGSLNATELQTLVDTLNYHNDSEDPNTADRVVTLTEVKDSGGTLGGGDDTATLNLTSTVTVIAVNDDPAVPNPIPDQSAAQDTPFSFQFAGNSFDDPDGDMLTYTATLDDSSPLPSWLSFDALTRTFSGTPANADVGAISVRVTAKDPSSTAVFDDFVITVANANDAPSDITLDNSAVAENADGAVIGNLGVVDLDAGDTHSWSVDDARFEIIGTQLKLKAGQSLDRETESTVNLTITATDQGGSGLDFDKPFTITVDNVNEAPVADTETYNVTAGNSLSVAAVGVLGGDYDPEGDPITAVLLAGPANGILILNADGSFNYTPNVDFSGTDSFVYEAWDGSASSASTLVTIHVTPDIVLPPPPPPPPVPDPDPDPDLDDPTEELEDDEEDETTETGPGTGEGSGTEFTPPTPKSEAGIVEPTETVDAETSANETESVRVAATAADADFDHRASEAIKSDANQRTAAQSTAQAINVDHVLMISPGLMWNELDQQMDYVESQIQGDLIVVGTAGAAASSFTVGAVAWALRTGFLASGLLAQMPAWKAFDPLLVMQGLGETGDEESLQEMMNRQIQSLDDGEVPASVS